MIKKLGNKGDAGSLYQWTYYKPAGSTEAIDSFVAALKAYSANMKKELDAKRMQNSVAELKAFGPDGQNTPNPEPTQIDLVQAKDAAEYIKNIADPIRKVAFEHFEKEKQDRSNRMAQPDLFTAIQEWGGTQPVREYEIVQVLKSICNELKGIRANLEKKPDPVAPEMPVEMSRSPFDSHIEKMNIDPFGKYSESQRITESKPVENEQSIN
ncbi:hypothetical protein [Arachidicoccus terrestris]|uniref:hypothetical protein n=1 Tax=Arachidicoccus terrestris TaxID=2875539 RepID=UPI001CC3E579|nr:hypothetical protein [Arachidicoccus terrestris]UAY56235.1 hypothetical protein K9M52_04245 [Arachidicoccus terrestris]